MVEIKSNKEMSKYIKELDEDVTITRHNIREKSMTAPYMRSKWLSYYYLEKDNLERIKQAKAKQLKQKMSFNKNTDSVLRLKTEESIAKNDEVIQKLNRLAEITQNNIEYIERAMDILAGFNYDIKNTLEAMKITESFQ